MKNRSLEKAALHYHAKGRPGKISVVPSKETANQRDLSLAYSPGVAVPCLEIAKHVENVYKYTAKANLVAVISNGTAVLGLGDIGPEASKPVMEGKSLLFKIYADLDCFDLELDTKDMEEFIRTVKILEPTFGGINLEDLSAPDCFEIEARLRKEMNIPIMHDDQHGTAIISGAALLNAVELVGKDIGDIRVVTSGAGAAALSCVRTWEAIGVRRENITMFDIDGQVTDDRKNMHKLMSRFATPAKYKNISEALVDADVFLGLSVGNIIKKEMIAKMAPDPIIFALANPTPEISYTDAKAARPDCIMATGRSDYPNQVNNVLGFPFIFRGAMDVRATEISEGMKLAAVYALRDLAKKAVPDNVSDAYGGADLKFGKEYIIPKPVDPRLITAIAPAVAKAAIEEGLAQKPITDWDSYEYDLETRLGQSNKISRIIETKARRERKKVVFSDAEDVSLLKAVQVVLEEGIAEPILLGDRDEIARLAEENNIQLYDARVIDPRKPANETETNRIESYAKILLEKMKRKGFDRNESFEAVKSRIYYGIMMVETGDADAMIGGLARRYPDTVRPALQIVGARHGVKKVAGMHILMTDDGPLFLADTTINHELNAENIADITELVAEEVRRYDIEPKIAMVTYSNFGAVPKGESAVLMRKATEILHRRHPNWIVDGEMQAHMALQPEVLQKFYPFSKLNGHRANVLMFPNLSSANIAYNLIGSVSEVDVIGPVLLGMNKPIHILQLGADVRKIVDVVGIAAMHAQSTR